MKNYRLNYIYSEMKQRCYNPKCKSYKDYGERGITVCDEWTNIEKVDGKTTKGWLSFKKWALENGYSESLTIDRIDTNGDYSPQNCRWVTRKVQANNVRTNRFITYNGVTKTLSEWSDTLKIGYKVLESRLNRYGWSVERAFETKDNCNFKMIVYKNKRQSLKEWCNELGLNYSKIRSRLNNYHWTIERAFETP